MVNVDVFLEHHGIKGQKWGVRNRRKPVIFESGKEWRKRPLNERVKAASVGTGLYMASRVLTRNAKTPVRLLANSAAFLTGVEVTTRLLEKSRKTPMKKVRH